MVYTLWVLFNLLFFQFSKVLFLHIVFWGNHPDRFIPISTVGTKFYADSAWSLEFEYPQFSLFSPWLGAKYPGYWMAVFFPQTSNDLDIHNKEFPVLCLDKSDEQGSRYNVGDWVIVDWLPVKNTLTLGFCFVV